MSNGKLRVCTICKKAGEWSESWAWYGSYLILENYPQDIIRTCSDQCRVEMVKKMNQGTIKLPVVKSHGMKVTKKAERVGY